MNMPNGMGMNMGMMNGNNMNGMNMMNGMGR